MPLSDSASDSAQHNAESHDSSASSSDMGLGLPSADYQTLLETLAQAKTLEEAQQKRIYHLEQALDQALICLADLRQQVQDQDILETQLATTEEYSQVQQQAIARLKLQLTERQHSLEAQILETQQRDQAVQELLTAIEVITQAQQEEIERLRARLAKDQRDAKLQRRQVEAQMQELQSLQTARQQRISTLEAEVLSARTQTASLQEQLVSTRQQIEYLSTQLSQERSSHLNDPLKPPRSAVNHSTRNGHGTTPSATSDWEMARQQVEELERQLANQVRHQTRWQHSHQELQSDRDRLQSRVTLLEEQAAEMQEQILQQAKQEAEYETAVQYWKDRYTAHQHHLLQLKHTLEATPAESDPLALEDLLEMLNAALNLPLTETAGGIPLPPLHQRLHTIELPEFLVRRRGSAKGQS